MCGNPFKSPKVPAAQKVDPTVTDVTNSQVSDDGDTEASKKKKKQGFAATRLATLLSNAGSKDTLG